MYTQKEIMRSINATILLLFMLLNNGTDVIKFDIKFEKENLVLDNITNTCQEDIPINRSVLTDFLEKPWWEPQRIETNTTNLSVSQIQSLTDPVDSSVCESFNTQYEEALNQLHQTGGKAYNVSYYKAGQFYFVIIGVKQPENPDVVAHGTTYFDVYDSNINFVKGYAF